ncbi:MAG TPA: DUF3618 domain-containing protein [Azospirillaceae bacterium]|nr:DUF3618 domain-containing protein [Azospirillaceae bacterium]
MTMTDDSLDRRQTAIRQTRAELSETLDTIRRRLDPENIKRQAMDMMRSPDGSSVGFTQTIRSNPVPIAMIGLGLGWLVMQRTGMFGGSSGHGAGGSGGAFSKVRDWTDRQTRGTRDSVRQAMARAGDTLHSATDKASDTLQHMRDRVSGGPSDTTNTTGGYTTGTGYAATGQSGGQSGPGYGAGSYGGATSAGHTAQESGTFTQVRSQFGKASGSLWHLVDEYPLAAGLMGLALGAAIGTAIPSTRYEDDLLGDVGDELRNRGLEYGAEAADRTLTIAQRAAEAGVEAARSEAEKQISDVAPGSQDTAQSNQGQPGQIQSGQNRADQTGGGSTSTTAPSTSSVSIDTKPSGSASTTGKV